MLLYCVIVVLGLIVSTKQKESKWNGGNDLNVHGNFIDSVQPRSHLIKLDVVCSKNHMTVNMQFDEPFHGMVFSKPSFKEQERCVHVGPQAGVLHATFDISYSGCGTVEDLKGQFHENTIIVQFGEDILEAWDEAKRLRCEWLESFEKPPSNQALHISELDAVELNFQGDDVDCWMEIQEGKGPWARPVAGLVSLGSPLTVVIAINDDSREFDMRVKQCDAHDERGYSSIKLTDEEGCVLRSTLLTPFVKVRDFGGKATLVAYSYFFAFKFPDHLDVYIRCVVEVCRHGCLESCPQQSLNHVVAHPRKPISSSDHPHINNKHLQHVVLENSVKNQLPHPGRHKYPLSVEHGERIHGHNEHANSLSNLLSHLQIAENKLQKHKLAALYDLAAGPSPLPAPPLQVAAQQQIKNHWIEHTLEPQPEPNSFAHPHHITTEELENLNLKVAPQPEPNSFAHPHHITSEELAAINAKVEPQPEPNSFAHPHHITSEELAAINAKAEPQPKPNSFAHPHHITSEQLLAAGAKNVPQPEPNSFAHPHHITSEQLLAAGATNVPQPEPNSFAHPHHITSEQLLAAGAKNVPQPEPNSFAHPHHITSEQLLAAGAKNVPQPEPNSFAHPHHITSEQLLAAGAKNMPQPEPNSFAHPHHITSEQLLAAGAKNVPQPEPNSFAHPHHITSEQLLAAGAKNVPQSEPNSFAHPHHITSEQLSASDSKNVPQSEPNSFAHPHHITTEQLQATHSHNPSLDAFNRFIHQQQEAASNNHRSQSYGTSPQHVPSSFAHSHHVTSEELQTIADPIQFGSTSFSNFQATKNDKVFISKMPPLRKHLKTHPDVIAVTLEPNGEMVFKYAPLTSSTIPQPAYISRDRFIAYNKSETAFGTGKSLRQRHAQQPFIDILQEKIRPPHNPYPVPQFSPRAQQMLSVVSDRRSDNGETLSHDFTERAPITTFHMPHEDRDSGLRKVPHGPRLLRTKRSQPVFGVQQKFRAIAPADLAFDWNATADNAAVFHGRREEIIYGICLSTAKFSMTLSLMLFITLCSSIISTFLFQRNQILQRKMKPSSTSSTLFNGQIERVYNVGHTNLATDIIEIS